MKRLDQLQDQLLKRLNSIFGAAISYDRIAETNGREGKKGGQATSPFEGREGVIETCMRSYVIAEKVDACQSVIRSDCMRPFISATVTVQKLEVECA